MSISLVMPCYNESAIIEETVRVYYSSVVAKIEGAELIVVDDCSSDGSYSILTRLAGELPGLRVLKTEKNSGHGPAVLLGYRSCRHPFIFQTDSDFQFPVSEFWRLYDLRERYDLVLGYRFRRRDSLLRLILSFTIKMFNLLVFGVYLKDANCAFRLMRRTSLSRLLDRIGDDSLAPNIMIALLAKRTGLAVAEIPVTYYSRVPVKTGFSGMRVLRFSFRGLRQMIGWRRELSRGGGLSGNREYS